MIMARREHIIPSMPNTPMEVHGKREAAKGVYADLRSLVQLQFKARGFSYLPRQPVHSILTGRYASRVRGRGLNFEEVRRYLPGDDIRNMDWKVTARTRKPHTRVFTEERDRPQIYVVDQRLSMFFGSKKAMKSVTAAETAALSAWRAFSVGDRVGALVFNDSEMTEIRPHRSRDRVMQILRAVVDYNHQLEIEGGIEAGPGMLNRALEKAYRFVGHDYLVGVISDFSGADEETRRWITKMAEHNDVILALIYDPLQLELPEKGRMVVSDGNLQIELDVGETKTRKAVTEFFPDRLEHIRGIFRQIAVPVLPIHTADGAAEQIRKLLGNVRS
jgi:uncharacterized protein (DUF58 family)